MSKNTKWSILISKELFTALLQRLCERKFEQFSIIFRILENSTLSDEQGNDSGGLKKNIDNAYLKRCL